MTALNLFVQRDRVTLVTDGAFYDDEGVVWEIASKIALAPLPFRMALAVSGQAYASRVADKLKAARSQGEAMAMLPGAVAAMHEEGRTESPVMGGRLVIAVGIWSDKTDRPEGWLISTDEQFVGPGYVAGTLVELEQMVVPSVEMMAFDLARFDPIADGRHVLEAQRWCRHSEDGAFYVGGFGEAAIVTREGASRHRLIEWADVIGAKIDPAALPLQT